ncbi:MAG TPA: ankyrin repeat domain-containing protein [Myxococcota bacterium]|nr:ankyrin repeat domain-containing protein [Myxococcota bacterium]
MKRFIPAILILLVFSVGCVRDPFYRAITKGDLEKIRTTVEADPGKAVEILDNGGYPLHIAAGYYDPEIVRYLLSKGADPNYRYKGNGMTPLMKAWPGEVMWMHKIFQERFPENRVVPTKEYLPILLEVVSLVNERLKEVRAAGAKGDNMAFILLDAGADINALDIEGRNALWYVMQNYGPVTCELLLEEGIEVLGPCLAKLKSDIDKITNDTLSREDLTIHETYWIDYGSYSQKYVIRFFAFSRQLTHLQIILELARRKRGVEVVVP